MTERLFEVEHQPGEEIVLRFKAPVFSILPEATRGHFKAARKEFLLGLRSLLDKEIERTEKATKTRQRTKVEVQ